MLLDKHGLIVTRNWKGELDGGDTLTNEFTYRTALAINESFDGVILEDKKLISLIYDFKKSLFTRHPDLEPLGDWSPGRDQMIAPIVYASTRVELYFSIDLLSYFIRNNFKYQSKDIPFIELWFLLTRMMRETGIKAYFKCLIGDLWILCDVLNRLQVLPKYRHDKLPRWKWFDHEDVDDRNTVLCLIQSRLHMPTFISKLAWFLYFRFRDWEYCLRHYFRLESGNNPEIAEELIRAVYKVKKR